MAPQRSTIRLADGRDLDVLVDGPTSAEAFLMINGTPSGVGARQSDVEIVAARGLRYVTYARPGYADSTRLPGRSVSDIASDVRELAGELGVSRLHVLGWSGGGPHALACAALLPDLVAGAATVAGVAPFDAEGLAWLDGMAPENLDEFGAAVAGPKELETSLEAFAPHIASATAGSIADALGELVPEVDRAALTGDFAEFIAAVTRDSVRTGIWGWFDDDMAFVRDWGFDLSAIEVPVTIWQGSQDKMVPFAHGRWLVDHVPGARARLIDGEGHLSLASSFDQVVDELV
jgi:pimeloyl-ACP methyl ester carboxylesterase